MQGKGVIVTGAFGVLGRAVTAALVARGAKVAAVDLAAAPAGGFAEPPDGGVVLLGGYDLADGAQGSKAIAAAALALDAVDALINLAGGFAWQTLADGDPAAWERLYRMNVVSCANACRAATPHLVRSHGRIVNVGAGGAVKAGAGMGAYAAAKGGVHRLTESLAEELKGAVAVNAVLPSIIDTPLNRRDMPGADFSTWVSLDGLAEVILFLASEAAREITGALVPVNGRV